MHEFSVYEYLSRIENAVLEIEENKKPIDAVIVLWWGLDGLRLNEDGTTEWISRRKLKPLQSGMLCKENPDALFRYTRERIDYLVWLGAAENIQEIQRLQNEYMMQSINSAPQSYTVQYPGYYPSYLYGGIMTGYAHPMYLPQMQNCCCNRLI